jgi:hypothetical protein
MGPKVRSSTRKLTAFWLRPLKRLRLIASELEYVINYFVAFCSRVCVGFGFFGGSDHDFGDHPRFLALNLRV